MIKAEIKSKKVEKVRKVDASGQSLGRVATITARYLQGKNQAEYISRIDTGEKVLVQNISKVKFTGKKFEQKKYFHHSNYPGGLRTRSLEELWTRNPSDVFRKMVWHMLPKNRLRKARILRLKIEE